MAVNKFLRDPPLLLEEIQFYLHVEFAVTTLLPLINHTKPAGKVGAAQIIKDRKVRHEAPEISTHKAHSQYPVHMIV